MRSIMIIPIAAIIFCGCMGGDHGSHQGRDTEKNIYGAVKDTSKVKTLPTDTTNMDNSASGGTDIPKPDSNKK